MNLNSTKEICKRGRMLYEAQLKPLLEKEHAGEYLILDIETEDYVVSEEYVTSLIAMQKKHEERLQYVVRHCTDDFFIQVFLRGLNRAMPH
jgi:hypothetical protein